MADIFLSYAREDRRRAANLAKALEGQGWSVFWDLTIPAGLTWDKYIGSELEKARCVVVVWSKAAVESDWVTEEAREGREKKILVPAFFAKVKPPFGFRGIQGPDLTAWRSSAEAPAFQALVNGIERILGPAPAKVEVPAGEKPAAKKAVAKKKTSAKKAATTKPAAPTKKPPARKPAPKKPPAAGKRAAAMRVADVKRGKGAPTWAEDEHLNHRILIEGGEFLMASPEGVGRKNEHPEHRVRLSPFHLQVHPVTNGEYRRFKPDHGFQGDEEHPAVNVSWEDADAYARWLGGRLPTEAEWEYACRAGTETKYWSGDSARDLARVGWYRRNSGGGTHPVCKKPANPWGLYDMHGNVWEWVADWYGNYSGEPQEDPQGPSRGELRVIRGGGFGGVADGARSAYRAGGGPGLRSAGLGFRVAFDAAPSQDE